MRLSRTAARRSLARHIFRRLRGSRNLIFAGSRQNVEWYADALREMSERARLPIEFFPHHASLSREHRTDLESRLRRHPATTVVCTSTLELGNRHRRNRLRGTDRRAFLGRIPEANVSAGRGVASGQPAVLRMYSIEAEPDGASHPADRLHLGLVRCIAMVQLLVEGWCEPPVPHAASTFQLSCTRFSL